MSINNSLIDTTDTTVYTSSGSSAVTTMFLCNSSTTQDVQIDIHIVQSGGSASSVNQVIKDLVLIRTDTFVFGTERILLGDGDKIIMSANISNISSATISYTEI